MVRHPGDFTVKWFLVLSDSFNVWNCACEGFTCRIMATQTDMMDITQAAVYLKVSVSHVRNLVRDRRVTFYRKGVKILQFTREDLDAWIQSGYVPAKQNSVS